VSAAPSLQRLAPAQAHPSSLRPPAINPIISVLACHVAQFCLAAPLVHAKRLFPAVLHAEIYSRAPGRYTSGNCGLAMHRAYASAFS
jgi:hypothetical protein